MSVAALGPDIAGAAEVLRSRLTSVPEVVVVLGSGLGGLAERLERPVQVSFEELPGFPPAGVSGHAGRWVSGRLSGRAVVVQSGRYHLYEGYPKAVVAAPVRLAAALGASFLVLTNAAGGVAPDLGPGDIVLLHDHIDLTARHPLTGRLRTGERRFPDMGSAWDPVLQDLAVDAARRLRIPVRPGTYAGLLGPSYETAAEVRMLARLGADVVGMSTVAEVIVARALGLRCLGLSIVANRAVGPGSVPLDHAQVVESVERAGRRVGRLLEAVVEALPEALQPGDAK